jgi:hypothetical protein
MRGVGWCINSFLLHLFIAPAEPSRFPSLVATPQAIKLAIAPAQPRSFYMISHRLPASFPTAKKKER